MRELYNSGMANHPDVLIIGGGIIGLTTAYLGAKAGLRVEVCDRTDLGREASWAGAGIIPPGNFEHAATPIDRLRAVGSEGLPQFSAELRERTGIDNGYRRCGGIEFLGASDSYALALWDAERIRYERLSPDSLRKLEPAIANSPGEPFHLPDCAQVRNPWHLRALAAACERIGVTLRPHSPVAGWVLDNSRAVGVHFSDGTVQSAGRFLLAAGAWSETLLKPLGHTPGVHPVLGQIVLLKPRQPVASHVLMLGKEYLVPRSDGRVLIGSTEEPEAGFEKRTTAEATAKLRGLALRLLPPLADAEVEKCWAGLRPGSPDGLPFLGAVPGTENVFVAAGHFRAGVQLSLGTARVMTSILRGETPPISLDEFRLDRPRSAPGRPAFRS